MLRSHPLEVTSFGELALRLGLAALIGLLLGLDREMRGHDAGIRTHALVALSSAMIMVSSLLLYAEMRTSGGDGPDPLRAVQGLAQSIGFIAAGLIFVAGGGVKNVTSAANLWLATAVGIAAGAGQFGLVAVTTALGVLLLTVVRVAERWLPKADPTQDDD